ncbi:synthetase [Aureococcus anophagefferens]|nr:synthetase [Aureococcus anophagefferens]
MRFDREDVGGDVRVVGGASSEVLGGANLASLLRDGFEVERRAMAALEAGEPAEALSVHTSAGVPPQLARFLDAWEPHLPPAARAKGDWCVNLQAEGASAVHAAVDMALQGLTHPVRYPVPSPFLRRRGEEDEAFHARLFADFTTYLDTYADEIGVLLVEPQWGRRLLLTECWDLDVDVVTFGKAIGGGAGNLLSGAILLEGAADFREASRTAFQSHTYAGSSARALANGANLLERLPELAGNVRDVHDAVGPIMADLADRSDGAVLAHGQGALWGGLFAHEDAAARTAANLAFKKKCAARSVLPYFVPVGGFMLTPRYDDEPELLAAAVADVAEAALETATWAGRARLLPNFGRVCRYETSLNQREAEIAILATAYAYKAPGLWTIHLSPVRRPASPSRSALFSSVEVNQEPIAVTAEGEYAANEGETPKTERFRAISLAAIDQWGEKYPRLQENMQDVKRAALIFPFKASPYLVDELIDWDMEADIRTDPFKLVFPTMDMLSDEHRELLDGKALNAPKKAELTGVQHKYAETVLFFAAAAQTCHAYCTYCFRWAQFIGDPDLRFAQKDADSLFDYLEEHPEVSDILFTGGDPMIMQTRMLKQYLEPFKDPTHLPHIKNLRIGTRALTFWPQRFTTDADADELMTLLREVKEIGGRHMAIMAHLGHVRELSTDKVKHAIHRLKQEGGVIIRSQSPVMRGINDDADVWAAKWREEVRLGVIPYYMFIARDTGAQSYFDVEIVGLQTIQGTEAFVLRFLQCRDDQWIGKVFAKYDPKAIWFDDLEPLDGMELPWEAAGLPVPCVDEPCQVEWLDEFAMP